ncbi:MAG: sulfatase-like hydrolase/transferase, partial [Anaerolineae bacterium]
AGTYLTDYLTDEAIRLIRGRDKRPFYLNYWPYAVHTPIQAPPDLVEKYTAKAKALGLDQVKTFALGQYYPCEHLRTRRIKRRLVQSDPVYAAMVENLDSNLGRMLAELEAAGIADNTLVIFTSDNGGLSSSEGSPTCNLPLAEGKGWMYEGGTREPLLIRWPGVTRAGSTCAAPVTTPDFYPTLLEAAGLHVPEGQLIEGVSLMPLLRGAKALEREAIYWHYPHYGNQGGTPGSSLRCGDWKLIEFFEDGRLELYNLADDPGEHHNRAADLPELAGDLHDRLASWRLSVAAKLPERNPDWVPPPWVAEE